MATKDIIWYFKRIGPSSLPNMSTSKLMLKNELLLGNMQHRMVLQQRWYKDVANSNHDVLSQSNHVGSSGFLP